VTTGRGSARPSLTTQTVTFPPIRTMAEGGTIKASSRWPVANCIVTYWPGRNRRVVLSTSASTTAVLDPWSTNGNTAVTFAARGGWPAAAVVTHTDEPTRIEARSFSP